MFGLSAHLLPALPGDFLVDLGEHAALREVIPPLGAERNRVGLDRGKVERLVEIDLDVLRAASAGSMRIDAVSTVRNILNLHLLMVCPALVLARNAPAASSSAAECRIGPKVAESGSSVSRLALTTCGEDALGLRERSARPIDKMPDSSRQITLLAVTRSAHFLRRRGYLRFSLKMSRHHEPSSLATGVIASLRR